MAILIILGLIVYFIPTIIGWNKKQGAGIFLLNLFLGWTIIGWLGSLIWAVSSTEHFPAITYTCPKCGYKHSLDQKVKVHVCPQCRFEAIYNNTD